MRSGHRGVPTLSRRGFLSGSAAVAVAGLLGACSNSDEEPTDSSGSSTTAAGGATSDAPDGPSSAAASASASGSSGASSSANAEGSFPVTVPGTPGAVTVKSAPQRVFAAGYLRDTDLALALGAPLVGIAKNLNFSNGLAPWQHPDPKVALVDTTSGLPFEKIKSLNPDLILAADDYTLDQDYDTLRKIAPTLCYDQGIGKDDWTTMTTRAAAVLGKPTEAARLIEETKGKISAVQQAHPEFQGKTYTFGPVIAADAIYTTSSAADASVPFFSQLGFSLSPKVQSLPASSTPGRAKISIEQIGLLDADVMILTYASDQVKKEIEGNPLFKQLAAVRRGSYVALDLPVAISFGFPSVLSIPYGLESVVPKLAAAVLAD
jgi:iron complex transport system substrate-binding protein